MDIFFYIFFPLVLILGVALVIAVIWGIVAAGIYARRNNMLLEHILHELLKLTQKETQE